MKKVITNESLQETRSTVTLLQGVFDPSFFDHLKKQNPSQIFVMEGRPSLEAGKNNCKELLKRGMAPTIIADNMAGFLFFKQQIKEVWLAYVDIDRRGVFCYVGASILGLLAKEHQIPIYCYPSILQKKKKQKEFVSVAKPKELIAFDGKRIAPKGTEAYVPLYEWVPGHNVGVNSLEKDKKK